MQQQENKFLNSISVSKLSKLIQNSISHAFPTTLCVEGEISGFKSYPSGHWYFSLIDLKSTIGVAMFRTSNRNVRIIPKNGLQVRLIVDLNFYAPNGKLQLIAKEMIPAGIGKQQDLLLALTNKLRQEGLFDLDKKKPLPVKPQCIGLITSSSGSVFQDMLTILAYRWPIAQIRLYETSVQGDLASRELCKALKNAIYEMTCDVLIIGRGGGSADDLSAFNDEILVRMMASCPIPIVSAVGHETDSGLTDFVADVRAATPSQAAELVSPDKNEVKKHIDGLENTLLKNLEATVSLIEQRLELITLKLASASELLSTNLQSKLFNLKHRLISPSRYIDLKKVGLHKTARELEYLILTILDKRKFKLSNLSEKLNLLSPLSTLTRGYGIISVKKKEIYSLVQSLNDLEKKDNIIIQIHDGVIDAIITQIKEKKNL